jgi:hypothetical protein
MWQVLATALVIAAAEAAAPAPAQPAAPPPPAAPINQVLTQPAPARPAPAQQMQQMQQHKPPNWRCFVRDAMVFYDRVHVRCYNKTTEGVTFFAVDTSQPIAVSLVTKALTAMQQGRPVKIAYAPESDLNPPGCRQTDCRRLLDITF